MPQKNDTKDWTLSDKRYGWRFACDGLVNSVEAARILEKSQGWISEILNSEDRKKPGGKGWPIRAGQPKQGGGWSVCVRSLHEYRKAHEPVEV